MLVLTRYYHPPSATSGFQPGANISATAGSFGFKLCRHILVHHSSSLPLLKKWLRRSGRKGGHCHACWPCQNNALQPAALQASSEFQHSLWHMCDWPMWPKGEPLVLTGVDTVNWFVSWLLVNCSCLFQFNTPFRLPLKLLTDTDFPLHVHNETKWYAAYGICDSPRGSQLWSYSTLRWHIRGRKWWRQHYWRRRLRQWILGDSPVQ